MTANARGWTHSAVQRLPLILAVAIVVGLLVFEFVGISERSDAPQESAPAPVTVTRVSRVDLNESYLSVGTVAGLAEVRIMSQIEGVVTAVLVRPGDRITAGQTLATLDDRLLRAELTQAEAAAQRSTDDLTRTRGLTERGIVETARLEAVVAQEAIDRAAVDRLRTQISLSRFPSPFDGVVTEQLAYPGDTVRSGSPLFGLADVSRLRIITKVPENIAARLTPGMTASVRMDDPDATELHARVSRVYPAADPVSHQTTAELDAGAVFPHLQPGFLVRLRLMLAERPGVLALGRQVVPDAMPHDTVALMVVRGGIAESRDVQLGAINETHVEVVNGLEENEVVVSRGGARLASGDPVRVIDAASVSDPTQ